MPREMRPAYYGNDYRGVSPALTYMVFSFNTFGTAQAPQSDLACW